MSPEIESRDSITPQDSTTLRTADDPPITPVAPIMPEGEAVVQPPLDNTPNDAPDEPATRIPHLGHALLFLAITGITLLLAQATLLGVVHPVHLANATVPPKLLLAAEAFTYIASLVVSWFIFPLMWQRSFPTGIQWNLQAATRNAFKLVPLGIALSFTVQAASSLLPTPKAMPMDDFFRTSSDVWIITAFGILLAPLFEEILFPRLYASGDRHSLRLALLATLRSGTCHLAIFQRSYASWLSLLGCVLEHSFCFAAR